MDVHPSPFGKNRVACGPVHHEVDLLSPDSENGDLEDIDYVYKYTPGDDSCTRVLCSASGEQIGLEEASLAIIPPERLEPGMPYQAVFLDGTTHDLAQKLYEQGDIGPSYKRPAASGLVRPLVNSVLAIPYHPLCPASPTFPGLPQCVGMYSHIVGHTQLFMGMQSRILCSPQVIHPHVVGNHMEHSHIVG
jgi:hypothetical protein